MSDKPVKDMTNQEIQDFLAGVLQELEYESIAAEIRLTKAYNVKFDFGNIAKRLVKQYTTALRAELGEEAATQFVKGIIAAVSN